MIGDKEDGGVDVSGGRERRKRGEEGGEEGRKGERKEEGKEGRKKKKMQMIKRDGAKIPTFLAVSRPDGNGRF